jgi:hypothetical protein
MKFSESRQEDIEEEWRYSSTHSQPGHSMELSGQPQASATLSLGKLPH